MFTPKNLLLLSVAWIRIQLFLHAQVSAGGTPIGFKFLSDNKIPVEVMPPVDVEALRQQDVLNETNKNIPYRFAYNHFTDIRPSTHGEWFDLEEGRLWALRIKSSGALSLNFGFENLRLAPGARLFLYNADRTEVLGAFTQEYVNPDYPFATELLNDDEVIVELYEPREVAGLSDFKIFRVSHGYRPLPEVGKGFGDSGNCMVNVNCPAGASYQDIKKSVICLVSGGSEFCSAALVNNTAQDGTPYVLTANHCVGGSVTNWVFRFNWEAPGCSNPSSNPASNSLTGGQLVASNAGSDFALLKITANNAISTLQSIGAVYAGWDRSTTPASSAICIHHPSGDIKKISLTSTANTAATYSGAQCWQTGLWTTGVTEPGSSGSPLFNPQKRIVGQLYGGPSSCTAPANQKYDYYGRFDVSWNGSSPSTRLRDWLDPGNTSVMTLDLYDPNAAPITLDAAITAITSPSGQYCGTPTIIPQVTLQNNGSTPLTSCQIQYRVNNGSWQTFNWTGTLNQGQSAGVTLPALNGLTFGSHIFKARVQNPNGGVDQNPANDSAMVTFTLINNAGVSLPLTEGFQGTFPPTGWTVVNPENFAWSSANVGGFGTSSKSAAINNFSTSTSLVGNIDDLIMPFVATSGLTGSFLQLKFDVAYARYNASYADTLKVLVSNDCGATWNTVYAKWGSTLATAPDQTTAFTPTASQWRTEIVDLSNYAGQPDIQIVFRNCSGWGNWLYLDNVNLTTQPPQPPLPSFTQSATQICEGGTITYTNTSQNTASVNWSFQGGVPSTSQSMGSVTVTYNTPGTFTTTLTATSPDGSTASTSQQVTIVANPQPVITQNGNVLSVTSSYAAYQWYLNGTPISGATGSNLTVQGNGSYMVEVTNNQGCKGFSNTLNIQNWALDEAVNTAVSVYPNPVKDILYLSHNSLRPLLIRLLDHSGRLIFEAPATTNIIDLTSVKAGIYYLELLTGEGRAVHKLAKL